MKTVTLTLALVFAGVASAQTAEQLEQLRKLGREQIQKLQSSVTQIIYQLAVTVAALNSIGAI